MRYKSAILDKLVSVDNSLKTLKFHYERGELKECRDRQDKIIDVLEEIRSLINTNPEEY